MAERRAFLLRHQDQLRQAVVCEPRGHDAIVGALLTPPVEPGSAAGVVFFNNAGALGMCGHGLIGVVRTLEYLGRLGTWRAARSTRPSARWAPTLEADGAVTIENVPAYCHAQDVALDVPGLGRVTGDVAWGGNWFFLTELAAPPLELANAAALTDATVAHPRSAALRRASRAGTAPRSTTSSSSARRIGVTPTRATSCSAPASPTTARPAAPGRRRSWPSSPRAASSLRASAGGRRASPARSSRAGSRRRTARSSPTSAAAPSSRAAPRSSSTRPIPSARVSRPSAMSAPLRRSSSSARASWARACAEALAEAGCRVSVLDAAFPGAGATGAAMGHLVVMDDSEAQFALTSYSRRLWTERAAALPAELEDDAVRDALGRGGRRGDGARPEEGGLLRGARA